MQNIDPVYFLTPFVVVAFSFGLAAKGVRIREVREKQNPLEELSSSRSGLMRCLLVVPA